MRVAVGIHCGSLDKNDIKLAAVLNTYNSLSRGYYIHASPTLFYIGMSRGQLSSCYLTQIAEDSIESIYKSIGDVAKISSGGGGVGLSIHSVRAKGSYVRGSNGKSNGLVPFLRVLNATARHVDQGGGKRKGAVAVYLEPWHADILDFLSLRKNHGMEEMRTRDLFIALWVPDLFMKRVEEHGSWTLMSPDECPGLHLVWGKEFEDLYLMYENKKKGRKTIGARDLWWEIIQSQIETGGPYMLYKDAANKKSNQQHCGCLQGSNLCAEIMEYTSHNEIAVCNLASLSLPRFLIEDVRRIDNNFDENIYFDDSLKDHPVLCRFDFHLLINKAREVAKNLDKVIDVSNYRAVESQKSNYRHRPMGIGVQGLADVYASLGLPFDSPAAKLLNKIIFEAIYFGALLESTYLAEVLGKHESYDGSPLSKGLLNFDMWNAEPSVYFNWNLVRERLQKFGSRNCLFVAPMPTATTANILGNHEGL
eukprot:GHVL01004551.1.p1 GENE.GHVL01004551.1~~GHVL01004551.1.p1  ORF type:complete len:478 (-),score=72.63 GHVL01004551.1:513-1946(-)